MTSNNYFRFAKSVFPFDDASPGSIESAYAAALSAAKGERTLIRVWRPIAIMPHVCRRLIGETVPAEERISN